MNDHTLQRLRTSRRYAWVGPGLAITCMVALVAWGLASQQPDLVVVASSAAIAAGVTGTSVWVSLSRRIAALEAVR